MKISIFCIILSLLVSKCRGGYLFQTSVPMIMTTWEIGKNATELAWKLLKEDQLPPMDCIEQAISQTCELNFCGTGVGVYDKIDEQGDFTLDAMMMDGNTKVVGGVGNLKDVREAISVARAVMKYSTSTLLTGEGATQFARDMGFTVDNYRTPESENEWEEWKNDSCQPNFRQNVEPDPTENCGPYSPVDAAAKTGTEIERDPYDGNHDTICQFIIDPSGAFVGVSTNGLKHKIPGRVGDSPLPGAGGYAYSGVGAAAATGNGDVMSRFPPSFHSVINMRNGDNPMHAVIKAVEMMSEAFPNENMAVMAANANGEFSAACWDYDTFPFYVVSDEMETTLIEIDCQESMIP